MGEEIEVKFAVEGDFGAIRERLTSAGAVRSGVVFERNAVFDAQDGRLFASGSLLRLREQQGAGASCLLTWKDPPVPDPDGCKRCREVETAVADCAAAASILAALGFTPVLAYEKLRESWELDGAHVCLDLLPFGRFVEIEAAPATIRRVAESLGLENGSDANYHKLNQDSRAARGLPPSRDFVFQQEEAERLRRLARPDE